jgi:hypothetical protein
VDEVTSQLASTIGALAPAARPVIVADWRNCKVLTPAVAERAVAMMAGANARIERSAILHAADSSTSVLQLMRLIKETNAPHRRLFTQAHELREWVGEVLNERENERLREFLMAARR